MCGAGGGGERHPCGVDLGSPSSPGSATAPGPSAPTLGDSLLPAAAAVWLWPAAALVVALALVPAAALLAAARAASSTSPLIMLANARSWSVLACSNAQGLAQKVRQKQCQGYGHT